MLFSLQSGSGATSQSGSHVNSRVLSDVIWVTANSRDSNLARRTQTLGCKLARRQQTRETANSRDCQLTRWPTRETAN
ncbi:hypothetical protein BT69DRAFT_901040 [Atractiella rhizophila]|nr:hypothetical protein BT69DRAFT_901040 [Atractiella rhizophila]